jgi:hypothetical protein
MSRPSIRLVVAALTALTAALAGCGGPDVVDRPVFETGGVERRLELADCAGEVHVVERLGVAHRAGAEWHDLRVDGQPYTLVTSRTPAVDLVEVLHDAGSLALAEVGADDARILTADGRVFASEAGAGFPEDLHDSLDPIAGLLLRSEVRVGLAGDDAGPALEVRRLALDNDNLGTCNGVTCSSKDGNESCCCKEKCVRNDTTCYCAKATQALTTPTGGFTSVGGSVLR